MDLNSSERSSELPKSMLQVSFSLTKSMLLVLKGIYCFVATPFSNPLQRYDSQSGGEKEIQRTMLELLNQLDGFDSKSDVKVIMATNKIETLDPALIRPGRIDRKIEFPVPDIKTKKKIFQIHTSKMALAEDVNVDELINLKDELSGADIKALCTEAGLLALRERRMKVTQEDLRQAKEKTLYLKKGNIPEGLYL